MRFFEVFSRFFDRPGTEFRFLVDVSCAMQDDGSSCSIYAVRNVLDLLDHRTPNWRPLIRDEMKNFRANATELLENAGRAYVPVVDRSAKVEAETSGDEWAYNWYNGKKDWGSDSGNIKVIRIPGSPLCMYIYSEGLEK